MEARVPQTWDRIARAVSPESFLNLGQAQAVGESSPSNVTAYTLAPPPQSTVYNAAEISRGKK
jgi:hypothetical protein